VKKVAEKYGSKKVVITGLGENILKDALGDFEVISVAERYGKDVSLATPSFAVAELLKNEL
jgi:hypothetical protein